MCCSVGLLKNIASLMQVDDLVQLFHFTSNSLHLISAFCTLSFRNMHATDADTDTHEDSDTDTKTDAETVYRATLYGHMRWQTTMRHISNYINVYLKNYTSDLREREEQPSMTSGKYTKVSRYMCSCIYSCVCVCVCQALPCK